MDAVDIACDESGSEGENITAASAGRVFAHASVDLTLDEATRLVSELRQRAPSAAAEYKSQALLKPQRAAVVQWLLGADGPLAGRTAVYLVDKEYMVVGKVVDLLVEELAHADGVDLYGNGVARELARALHREGPRALGQAAWDDLLACFNSLTRVRQRGTEAKATVDDLYARVETLRLRATRRRVTEALDLIWRARVHAEEFQERLGAGTDAAPTLDPLIATVPQVARVWSRRHPLVRLVHDRQAALTDHVVASIVRELASPFWEFRRFAGPVRIAGIVQVDSRDDARVQVADLLAGVARQLATRALLGPQQAGTDPAWLQPHVCVESLWSDEPSWLSLAGGGLDR